MIGELAAALALALVLLYLVIQPLVRPPRRAPAYVPPEPEETARGVALAALRDLEFDRETGKLSDTDYAFLKSEYTTEALRALRADAAATAFEADGSLDPERLVAQRRQLLTESGTECRRCGPRPEADARFCSACGDRVESGRTCERCQAMLAPDARFCEACGVAAAA